ncbi:hypothetical protein JTB14_015306 [Gonioctena quinquepunctata]|nr:hypothetical protein JTB14_015306 [Gonioctena quinquepunctata]
MSFHLRPGKNSNHFYISFRVTIHLPKNGSRATKTTKKAAQKALVHVCAVCKAQMPDPKTYKQHFENKHPKNEVPADLKDV